MTAILAAVLGFFAYPIVVCIFGLILSVIYISASEHEDSDYDSLHGWAIFLTIIAGLVYFKPVIAFLSDWSWHFILLAIIGYGIMGGANSVFRWFKLCRKYVETHPKQSEETYREQLRPAKYKGRLIGWIVYWPWSLFWNILGDFFTGIYDALANVYNRVAASVIRKAIGR